ncbi:MAG: hypothetical protein Q7S56_03400 [Nanoarchaeota archaeon]|nr:hypothetical protein [Nanoarchaeota archaeon]
MVSNKTLLKLIGPLESGKLAENESISEEQLKRRARPYKELLIPIEGIVKSVSNRSLLTDYISNEFRRQIPIYRRRLEIELKNIALPRILIFNGDSPILAQQKIRAYVFKGTTHKIGERLFDREAGETIYLPRKEFNEEEAVEYIEILSRTNKVLRTDYAAD